MLQSLGASSWTDSSFVVTKLDIVAAFRKYGATDARVMLDRVTQRSRGFGFVHFGNKDDMDEAIEKMHEVEIDGRKISVTRAIPQDSVQPGTPAAALGKRDRSAPCCSLLMPVQIEQSK